MPVTCDDLPRWWEYASERRLFCGPPGSGHRLPNTVHIVESGFIRCNHIIGPARLECGRWVFVFVVRGGKSIVVEVKLSEIEAMKRLGTPAEMLDYLGVFERTG